MNCNKYDPIRLKEDCVVDSIRYTDNVTLDAIEERLQSAIEEYGFPVEIVRNTLSVGGFFNSSTTDVIACYNPDHAYDYYNYSISVKSQGKGCIITIHLGGYSPQLKNEDYLQNTKVFRGGGGAGSLAVASGLTGHAAFAVGTAVGGLVGGAVGAGGRALKKGIVSLMTNKQAVQDEKDWYDNILYMFGEVFN